MSISEKGGENIRKDMQKPLIVITLTIIFALAFSGAVSAADNENLSELANANSSQQQNNASSIISNQSTDSNSNNCSKDTGYGSDIAKKSISKNIISGVVLDCITFKPFVNAKITISSLSGLKLAETISNQNGFYSTQFESSENLFKVTASSVGHTSPTKDVQMTLNQDDGISYGTANFTLGQPTITISGPSEVFINEPFTLDLTFNNTGSSPGFAPLVQLFLPPGVTYNSATFLGSGITVTDAGLFPVSGQLYDPVILQIVTGPVGYRLLILEYPLGSFTPGQTPVTINAALKMGTVPLGTPLSIYAQPWFRLGNTPIDDPSTDPPINGTRVQDDVNPIVMKLTKKAILHEDETATGPNYPVRYELYLDIANGTTVTNINVTDILSGNLQYLNLITSDGGSVIQEPSISTPGTLIINFNSITGSFGGPEKTIAYNVYAPEFNSTSGAVLDPNTGYKPGGGIRNATNNANANGTYLGNTIISDGPESDYLIRLLHWPLRKV